MYSDWGLLVWLVALIWLLVLTYLIWTSKSSSSDSKKILKSIFEEGGDSEVKFDQFIRKVNGLGNQLDDLKDKLTEAARDSLGHIQRIELLRFNPYEDTGGDQSFTVALLDKDGNGVVVTSLHSRSTTRVFAKPVILGRAEKYEFSREEQDVVKKAMGR